MKILISTVCLSFCSLPLHAAPPPVEHKPIQVDYEFLDHGRELCHGRIRVQSGVSYRVCETDVGGRTFDVRMNADFTKDGGGRQISVEAQITKIRSDGKIVDVGYPKILALDNEPASIEVGEKTSDGEKLTFAMKVTAHQL
jgi:hypothetical protein